MKLLHRATTEAACTSCCQHQALLCCGTIRRAYTGLAMSNGTSLGQQPRIWRKADVIGPTGHYCQHNSCAAASRDATRNLEQGLVELRPVMPEGAQALPALPPEIWVKNLSSLPFTDRYVRRCMCRQMQRPLLALLTTFCWCRLATIPLVCKAWKKIAQPACPIWQSCEIKDGAAKPLDLVKVMR